MRASAEQSAIGFYERCIACLNARAWDRLGEYVAVDVVHNGRPLSLDGYRAMLEENCRDIPDLYFQVEFVVAEKGRIASRPRFDCAPTHEFLGVRDWRQAAANGQAQSVNEAPSRTVSMKARSAGLICRCRGKQR
jgi:predicted ester cyclase